MGTVLSAAGIPSQSVLIEAATVAVLVLCTATCTTLLLTICWCRSRHRNAVLPENIDQGPGRTSTAVLPGCWREHPAGTGAAAAAAPYVDSTEEHSGTSGGPAAEVGLGPRPAADVGLGPRRRGSHAVDPAQGMASASVLGPTPAAGLARGLAPASLREQDLAASTHMNSLSADKSSPQVPCMQMRAQHVQGSQQAKQVPCMEMRAQQVQGSQQAKQATCEEYRRYREYFGQLFLQSAGTSDNMATSASSAQGQRSLDAPSRLAHDYSRRRDLHEQAHQPQQSQHWAGYTAEDRHIASAVEGSCPRPPDREIQAIYDKLKCREQMHLQQHMRGYSEGSHMQRMIDTRHAVHDAHPRGMAPEQRIAPARPEGRSEVDSELAAWLESPWLAGDGSSSIGKQGAAGHHVYPGARPGGPSQRTAMIGQEPAVARPLPSSRSIAHDGQPPTNFTQAPALPQGDGARAGATRQHPLSGLSVHGESWSPWRLTTK